LQPKLFKTGTELVDESTAYNKKEVDEFYSFLLLTEK
jgi:hypothetical protein